MQCDLPAGMTRSRVWPRRLRLGRRGPVASFVSWQQKSCGIRSSFFYFSDAGAEWQYLGDKSAADVRERGLSDEHRGWWGSTALLKRRPSA